MLASSNEGDIVLDPFRLRNHQRRVEKARQAFYWNRRESAVLCLDGKEIGDG